RLSGQSRDHERITLAQVVLEFFVAERPAISPLHPGQATRGEIGRRAQTRQIFKDREACRGAFEGDRKLGRPGPAADREHLAPTFHTLASPHWTTCAALGKPPQNASYCSRVMGPPPQPALRATRVKPGGRRDSPPRPPGEGSR